jgi:putative transposase
MPRKPRHEVAGGVHHVFARGNGRRPIFLDDADHRLYLAMLGRVVARSQWRCLAFCLMENHIHLLVETPKPNLGAGMQQLHGRFAQRFNQRHTRSGHVFQGRYGSVPVRTDEHLWTTVAYIVANPVAAGLCRAPDDWPWSSHRAVLGDEVVPWLDVARLLSFYTSLGGEPVCRYAAHVCEQFGHAPNPISSACNEVPAA